MFINFENYFFKNLDYSNLQLDERIFIAPTDAMSNMNLLCRLNIEFVCEISDGRRETSRLPIYSGNL